MIDQEKARYKFAILLSTLTNISILYYLQSKNLDSNFKIFILATAYLLVSLSRFLKSKFSLNSQVFKPKILLPLSAWALSISTILIIFLLQREKLDIRDITISQALAPYVGLFLSLDFFKEDKSKKSKFFKLIPLSILILLVLLKNKFSIAGISSFVIYILILFSIAQTTIRIVARGIGVKAIYTAGGFLIFLFLISYLIFTDSFPVFSVNFNFFKILAITSLCVWYIQVGFLVGIKNLPATTSTTLISSSIPISILFYFIIDPKSQEGSLILVSIIYLCSIYLVQKFDNKLA